MKNDARFNNIANI